MEFGSFDYSSIEHIKGNEQKMFDWTKAKSSGRIDVSTNEHI